MWVRNLVQHSVTRMAPSTQINMGPARFFRAPPLACVQAAERMPRLERTSAECAANLNNQRHGVLFEMMSLIGSVDVFCGAGGLTRGLRDAGIDVRLGVDLDPACEYPFAFNNRTRFLRKPVQDLNPLEVTEAWQGSRYSLLAGCAPCQPFSLYSQGKTAETDGRWNLLAEFQRLVLQARPTLVTMENVPRLAEQMVFNDFVEALKVGGYSVSFQAVKASDYGVPQQRERLVLLASKLGSIELIPPTHSRNPRTVRKAISSLPPLEAGGEHSRDPLHQAATLSPINLRRIRASKPGGTWRDWDKTLVAACHRRRSGKTYPSVYGRMSWDEPAPTMTTQFFGFGNGRFGHPEQDRAISLREGAIIQSFPKSYRFVKPGSPIHFTTLGRLIGNAVPVKLGEAIGRSLVAHVLACEANASSELSPKGSRR
jgi:DNA (cytosine-5)-methyltransferase 1